MSDVVAVYSCFAVEARLGGILISITDVVISKNIFGFYMIFYNKYVLIFLPFSGHSHQT